MVPRPSIKNRQRFMVRAIFGKMGRHESRFDGQVNGRHSNSDLETHQPAHTQNTRQRRAAPVRGKYARINRRVRGVASGKWQAITRRPGSQRCSAWLARCMQRYGASAAAYLAERAAAGKGRRRCIVASRLVYGGGPGFSRPGHACLAQQQQIAERYAARKKLGSGRRRKLGSVGSGRNGAGK